MGSSLLASPAQVQNPGSLIIHPLDLGPPLLVPRSASFHLFQDSTHPLLSCLTPDSFHSPSATSLSLPISARIPSPSARVHCSGLGLNFVLHTFQKHPCKRAQSLFLFPDTPHTTHLQLHHHTPTPARSCTRRGQTQKRRQSPRQPCPTCDSFCRAPSAKLLAAPLAPVDLAPRAPHNLVLCFAFIIPENPPLLPRASLRPS
jgi:hypothetical protein